MSSSLTILLLSLALSMAIFTAASAADLRSRKDIVGGWTPIKDLNDPDVQAIAKFAVSDYNSKYKATLKLLKVLKGDTQTVKSINYRQFLDTTDGAVSQKYQAIVWENPTVHSKQLTSFISAN